MVPKIRYCSTEDGVSIAYWDMGEGPALLYMPPLMQHAQLEWAFDDIRGLYQWLLARHRVIRFDPRNYGLSQRGVEDVSIEARLSDVHRVLDRAGVERFSVWGHGISGSLAISIAAAWPDRVERLILVNAYMFVPGLPTTPAAEALRALTGHDWETYTEVLAGVARGWGDPGRAAYAQLIRDSVTAEDMQRGTVTAMGVPPFAEVRAPTLVVHHRQATVTNIELGRRLASEIPDAQLVALEGRNPGTSTTDPHMIAAVEEFEGLTLNRTAAQPRSGTQTVLFTDLVNHSEMMQRLGDEKGRDVLRDHERITRDTLKAHGGDEVKTMGDGFMASFASATKAIDCAIALQRAISAREGEPLAVRVGLNAGEPIAEDGDLFGATVILASRIAAKADAGEILVPETVRGLVSGKSFLFADRGEFLPKGFDDAVRLYEVKWDGTR